MASQLLVKKNFSGSNDSWHPYNLRNTKIDLALPMLQKVFGERCFNSMGASLWNNLSLEAIISQLLSSFKATLKQRIG